MEIKEKLFENIIVIGKSSGSDILSDIEAQEEKIANKDLYDAMYAVNKVLAGNEKYVDIQGVDTTIDVNSGTVTIKGATKEPAKVYDDGMDLNGVIDMFAMDLTNALPDGLKLKHEIVGEEDETMNLPKVQFIVNITRKG